MNTATKNRLSGLNSFLSDLFGEEILISQILETKGLSKGQIERIRAKHLNEYLEEVSRSVYHYISGVLPKKFANTIWFCYYFNGKKPEIDQLDEEGLKAKIQQISELQADALTELKKVIQLQLFKNALVTPAKKFLTYEKQNKNKYTYRERRRIWIKKSAERIRKAKNRPYKLPPRPPTELTEEEKAKNLKIIEKHTRAPSRVFEQHKPERKMFNPWLGSGRYRSNWW